MSVPIVFYRIGGFSAFNMSGNNSLMAVVVVVVVVLLV